MASDVDFDELEPTALERADIGNSLRTSREEAGMSVEELADRLNLRPSFIRAVESGESEGQMAWVYERAHIRSMFAVFGIASFPLLDPQ